MKSKGFKRSEFIFKTIMKYFSEKELQDNLKIHDLAEAISRATTRATIVYASGDQSLSEIEQQFKDNPKLCQKMATKKHYANGISYLGSALSFDLPSTSKYKQSKGRSKVSNQKVIDLYNDDTEVANMKTVELKNKYRNELAVQ
ncbi:hypothetical protein QYM36_018988, partial [Artemia franciscana]